MTAWVRIPKLSVEYFNKDFLLHKIGSKIGKVWRVDNTTTNVERGQFIRMSVEVDLTKPLLSRFRLNGRIWRIQYEGLRMICFKCGTQGHKEDACPNDKFKEHDGGKQSEQPITNPPRPEEENAYGSWMLVRKPPRCKPNRQPVSYTHLTLPTKRIV